MPPNPDDDETPADVRIFASEVMQRARANQPFPRGKDSRMLLRWSLLAGAVLFLVGAAVQLQTGFARRPSSGIVRHLFLNSRWVSDDSNPLAYWGSIVTVIMLACGLVLYWLRRRPAAAFDSTAVESWRNFCGAVAALGFFLLLGISQLAGGVSETVRGEATVFAIQLWFKLGMFAVAACAIAAAALALRERCYVPLLWQGLLVLGAGVSASAAITNRVEVTPGGFTVWQGVWGARQPEVLFGELTDIVVTTRRGRPILYRLFKNGGIQRRGMKYSPQRDSLTLILARASQRGVLVHDERDGPIQLTRAKRDLMRSIR